MLIDDDNLKMMVEILKHAASDSKTRREMEEAWWAEEDEKEYEKMEKELQESKKSIAEKDKRIAELERQLKEQTK